LALEILAVLVMKIKIIFLKILNIKKAESGSFIEVKDGCTVRELLEY
jgi:hypothetical protein